MAGEEVGRFRSYGRVAVEPPPEPLMAALRYMSGRELANRRSERVKKLEWIEQQVASGELVIRQATAEERERYGIAAPAGRDRRGRRPERRADDGGSADLAA